MIKDNTNTDILIKIQNLKMEMINKGWSIEETTSSQGWNGSIGYSIWLRRYEWHGKHSLTITGREPPTTKVADF